jgi:hypothetical protein
LKAAAVNNGRVVGNVIPNLRLRHYLLLQRVGVGWVRAPNLRLHLVFRLQQMLRFLMIQLLHHPLEDGN